MRLMIMHLFARTALLGASSRLELVPPRVTRKNVVAVAATPAMVLGGTLARHVLIAAVTWPRPRLCCKIQT